MPNLYSFPVSLESPSSCRFLNFLIPQLDLTFSLFSIFLLSLLGKPLAEPERSQALLLRSLSQ